MTKNRIVNTDETLGYQSSFIETELTGFDLLIQPLLNKGMAFTQDERDLFQLHGLLPADQGTMESQLERRLKALDGFTTDFQRYAFMRDLQDTNETLFYALLVRNMAKLLPIVYTPTVGEGCQRFSEIWRKPRGLFLSYTNRSRIRTILANPRYDKVRIIVVSDGERILGLGDQGAGGMGIPIGKLALYTACAGIHPELTLPITLDVGTNNTARLQDPLYIGWRHARIRGQEYDDFIEEFIQAVIERWPNVLLQWEDFAGHNASRLLERYRDKLCTFNDDIQGTAAVATGTLMAAIKVTGTHFKDQRIAVFGCGSAGCGISNFLMRAMIDGGLSEDEARSRFYLVDKDGLLIEGMPDITPAQMPFLQKMRALTQWSIQEAKNVSLLDVVRNASPTCLIGVSGQSGAFTADIIEAMAERVERPVIFPLSNPTSRCEATPDDLLMWTRGKALVGTGSPFPPVHYEGKAIAVDQTNNSYTFPGVGLGVLATQARRITDSMLMASAKILADLSPYVRNQSQRLLPCVEDLRSVAQSVALAVGQQAMIDGVATPLSDIELKQSIQKLIWEPIYRPYHLRRDVGDCV